MKQCYKCHQPLTGTFRRALNHNYHTQCFTCHVCNKQLRGSEFQELNGQPICDNDYRQTLEKCSVCQKPITDSSLNALGNTYHPKCFKCSVCHKSINEQKFFTDDNRQIYCQNDYTKKLAKTCNGCKQTIIADSANEQIYVNQNYYHKRCYKCESCGVLLSGNNNESDRVCVNIAGHIICKKCSDKITR